MMTREGKKKVWQKNRLERREQSERQKEEGKRFF